MINININKMKLAAVFIAVGLLTGCGSKAGTETSSAAVQSDVQQTESQQAETAGKENGSLKIVATVFPAYEWTKEIIGDTNADITLLLDNGVDIHSYQPTIEDMTKIADCDLMIYVGGTSDAWVNDILANASNPNMQVIDMMSAVGDGVKEEAIVEGMEADDDHDHEAHSDEVEYDEHVWLSLTNAQHVCEMINEKLATLDSANAAIYEANTQAYVQQLAALNDKYEAAVKTAPKNTLLFGDRFPFRYLIDDYNLKYYAAFPGCSAETEASFETISYLAKKVDELGLKAVITVEGSDDRIAETIISNTKDKNQKILTMDSLQSVTADDMKNGKTYLSTMEKNLEVLKEALE